METLLTKTKIAHSVRIFGLSAKFRKSLTLEDLDAGVEGMNFTEKDNSLKKNY